MTKVTPLFDGADRRFGTAIRAMTASNPFLPERIAAEREALGAEFEERGADWNTRPPTAAVNRNSERLIAPLEHKGYLQVKTQRDAGRIDLPSPRFEDARMRAD